MSPAVGGAYRPGTSVLHRAPAGAKLVGLAVAGGVVLTLDAPREVGAAVVVVAALYALAGAGPRTAWAQVRPLRLVVPVLLAVQWLTLGPVPAVVLSTRLVALVALAGLVLVTTRSSAVLAAIECGLRPLRHVGVDVDRAALVLSLAVRSVPVVAALAQRVCDACRARGREHDVRAWAVPLVVGALRQADAVGDALRARGLDD
ncbi:energy-coupling factor transporter transmembrane component T family protein [Cellulosimicrobium marinum]|uniref:energy-coupling factor transporter transmembrane component T family protein n=1 Tax=Cellulosimicrobium marinum TaxID=1638992 RepID=UPI001E65433C|nr:energy-coupling factor transporter transmembrane protein EcfT [Cellulosimicrobium marinum]MCB7136393.1 energy-coupling factor transporter transmembrane protein EcfT [Cellulosimicrobium marinum]